MKLAQITILIIQILFIMLVFVIVFGRPRLPDNSQVLGRSIDVSKTLSACQADINKDTIVNELDFEEIKMNFLREEVLNPAADITSDSLVDLEDYSLVSNNYNQQCP